MEDREDHTISTSQQSKSVIPGLKKSPGNHSIIPDSLMKSPSGMREETITHHSDSPIPRPMNTGEGSAFIECIGAYAKNLERENHSPELQVQQMI